jgi:hypothetical protein
MTDRSEASSMISLTKTRTRFAIATFIAGTTSVALTSPTSAQPTLAPPITVQNGVPPGLVGPQFIATVEFTFGGDILPPGAGTVTKPMVFDPGSALTIVNRANAQRLGLIRADGTPDPALLGTEVLPARPGQPALPAGQIPFGGVVGGDVAWFSKAVTICALGSRDVGPFLQVCTPGKRIVFPITGRPDLMDLLGTNFVANMTTSVPTTYPDGSLSLFDPPANTPGTPPGTPPILSRKVRLLLEPTPPSLEGLTHERRFIENVGINGAGQGNFLLSGSPFTILSSVLASALGVTPTGTFDLFHEDPDVFRRLFVSGFVDDVDPGPFGVATVDLSIPTEEPGINMLFSDVPVLINPFATD